MRKLCYFWFCLFFPCVFGVFLWFLLFSFSFLVFLFSLDSTAGRMDAKTLAFVVVPCVLFVVLWWFLVLLVLCVFWFALQFLSRNKSRAVSVLVSASQFLYMYMYMCIYVSVDFAVCLSLCIWLWLCLSVSVYASLGKAVLEMPSSKKASTYNLF